MNDAHCCPVHMHSVSGQKIESFKQQAFLKMQFNGYSVLQ